VKKIPVVICIDVEPDERLIDPNLKKPWTGFERTFEFFTQLRFRVVTRPDQCSNMEQTLEYLLSHDSISEMAFNTPAEMIAARSDS